MVLFKTAGLNLSVQRLLYTETGQIAVSIILALGIAMLFRKVCKDRKCIVIEAPTPEAMRYTYELEGDCYRYTAKATACIADK